MGDRGRREEIPDEALMERYARGDVEAFDRLFRRWEHRVYVFFLKRTGSPERAQDLYQDLFLRIHRARDRYDPRQPFAPWLFQIASHLLVDDCRRAFRSHEIPIADREPTSEARDGEEQAADREQIAGLLGRLSADERYVLVCTQVEGIGYSRLADRLGRSTDSVRKMASRALGRLRRVAPAEAPS